jgi:hypothetical protein
MRKKLKWILILLALALVVEQAPSANAAGFSQGGGGNNSAAYKRDANYKSVSK